MSCARTRAPTRAAHEDNYRETRQVKTRQDKTLAMGVVTPGVNRKTSRKRVHTTNNFYILDSILIWVISIQGGG